MLHQGLVNIDFDNNKIKFVSNGHIISKENLLRVIKEEEIWSKRENQKDFKKRFIKFIVKIFYIR